MVVPGPTGPLKKLNFPFKICPWISYSTISYRRCLLYRPSAVGPRQRRSSPAIVIRDSLVYRRGEPLGRSAAGWPLELLGERPRDRGRIMGRAAARVAGPPWSLEADRRSTPPSGTGACASSCTGRTARSWGRSRRRRATSRSSPRRCGRSSSRRASGRARPGPLPLAASAPPPGEEGEGLVEGRGVGVGE